MNEKKLHDHHEKNNDCYCGCSHHDKENGSNDTQRRSELKECTCPNCDTDNSSDSSSESPPGDEEPERHLEHHSHHHHDGEHKHCAHCEGDKESLCTCHNHEMHDHDHHHGGWHKPDNIFLKWIWYFFLGLGLVSADCSHNHAHVGHKGHVHAFSTKTWILIVGSIIGVFSLIAMISILFVSKESNYYEFIKNDWLQLTLGTFAFIIMGLAFIKGSYVTIKMRLIAEDTLVAIAVTSAYLYSLFAIIFNNVTGVELPYFFYEAVEILWLIYLGRYIESKLMHKIMSDIDSLQSLKPKLALVIRDDKEIEVDVNEIKINDIIIVKSGSIIPVDGRVIYGETTVDESSLTGESLPITKTINSNVFGGTISSNGLIKVKVAKTIDESFISKIIDSVSEAVETKPITQRIADRIASILVPAVLIIAMVTFILTGVISSFYHVPNEFINQMEASNLSETGLAWMYAFYIVITILVIACPCSFAMQTPMSVLVSSRNARKNGIIFSSKNIFENIKNIDVIAFDKTGTLTGGKFKVIKANVPKEYISKLVAVESASNHPLALSILEYYKDVKVTRIASIEIIGKGMETRGLKIGSLNWVKEIHPNYKDDEELSNLRKKGVAIIYLFNDQGIIGHVILKDEIKESSRLAISNIRKMGIEVVMITGDNKETSLSIASELGIKEENVFSEVDPNQKSEIISNLQTEGKKVAFVGDGINDSVALTRADLGIAIGEGSDAAIDAADIVLNENDLSLVAYAIWLSNRTVSTIKRGFGIAVGYNVLMIPIAATGVLGLTGFGPALASLFMIFNDSIAMVNATTLNLETRKKFKKKINKN